MLYESTKRHRIPMQLIFAHLGLIAERLTHLPSLTFDRDEFTYQADALVSDIRSVRAHFLQLKDGDSFSLLKQPQGDILQDLLGQIDYELTVVETKASSLRKGFPEDENFYRSRLWKLSNMGHGLDDLRKHLDSVYFHYYF